VVFLAGLDEVLDAVKRQFVAAQVEALLRQWATRGNRFAITSRIVGYREARVPGDLPHVTVLDFGRSEMALFAHQWCRAYEIWVAGGETPTALQRAATEEKALLDDVQSNPSVERLAASPLLLTMLALLRRHVGKLPDRRIDLYASYVRTLIDNWQIARSRGARQQMPERFDPHTAIALLIDLAFWLQQHKPSGTARRQELEHELEKICLRFEGRDPDPASPKERVEAQQTTTHFLRDMRHFAGLLAERGRDAFGFLHLTFQEYFAGRALARMDPEQRWQAIAPNLHRQRWREPILLCAGQLGVMEQRRDQASDLAKRILEQYDVRRAAVQALASLVGSEPAVRQTIISKLDDEEYDVRQAAVQALAGLVSRDDDIAQRLLPWLGTVAEQWTESAPATRRLLAKTYAPLLAHNSVLLDWVASMLTSFSWEARQGAAWTLMALPDGPPPHLHRALLGLLDDLHTEASWPERLQVCEILINARDHALSTRAITLAIEALDYATQPWYGLPETGASVRQQAARILGQLEPVYRDDRVFGRLAHVLDEDEDEDVRDAAYQALLRLAAAPESVS
jgi:HEAT repeat protein